MQQTLLARLEAEQIQFQKGIDAIEVLKNTLRSYAAPIAMRGQPKVQAAEPATRIKKRKLSAEGRKRIVEATTRRWAAKKMEKIDRLMDVHQAENGKEAGVPA